MTNATATRPQATPKTINGTHNPTTEAMYAKAHTEYRASLTEGNPWSGRELGELFDRSESWGLARIKEVRDAPPPRTGPHREETPATPALADTAPDVDVEETAETITPTEDAKDPAPDVEDVPETPAAEPQQKPKPRKPIATWPVLLMLLPATVAIWTGWVGLGELAGFGPVRPLPGIWDSLTINSAITLPIGMEAYSAYALYVWLSGRATDKAMRFARSSALFALVLGTLGQVAYHMLAELGVGSAPMLVTAGVACIPVGVVGLGAALAHMVRAGETADE